MADFFYSDVAAVDLDSVNAWIVREHMQAVLLFLSGGQTMTWEGDDYPQLLQRLAEKYPRRNERDFSQMSEEEREAYRVENGISDSG